MCKITKTINKTIIAYECGRVYVGESVDVHCSNSSSQIVDLRWNRLYLCALCYSKQSNVVHNHIYICLTNIHGTLGCFFAPANRLYFDHTSGIVDWSIISICGDDLYWIGQLICFVRIVVFLIIADIQT